MEQAAICTIVFKFKYELSLCVSTSNGSEITVSASNRVHRAPLASNRVARESAMLLPTPVLLSAPILLLSTIINQSPLYEERAVVAGASGTSEPFVTKASEIFRAISTV